MPRPLLILLALLSLGGAFPAAAQHAPGVRAAWGFDRSDLRPHPDVRFGVLANGMRYAIMRHPEPPGALSIRLRFDVGSTAERETEQGMMHLVEHMVFEGTRRLPRGRMIERLARAGLVRPGDFAAATYPHDTVYRLDLIQADPEAVDTGLEVMEQIAAGLDFSPRLVERARGQAIAELESRSVGERIGEAQTLFFMPGTPVAERPAHGELAPIRRATPAALRRLYRRYYVPQRATLVVVGDVDPGALEAAVRARFGRWRARPSPSPDLTPRIDPRRPGEVRLFIDPAAPTAVTIASVAPLGGEADAAAPRDRAFLAHLGCRMLAHRLHAQGQSGDCAIYDHFATARVSRIDVPAPGRDWPAALAAARRALAAALERGFTAEELRGQVAAMVRAAPSAPRTGAALADAIAASLQAGTIFTEPQDPAGLNAYLARVRIEEVDAAFRAAWATPPGRLLFISHDRPVPDPPPPLE